MHIYIYIYMSCAPSDIDPSLDLQQVVTPMWNFLRVLWESMPVTDPRACLTCLAAMSSQRWS